MPETKSNVCADTLDVPADAQVTTREETYDEWLKNRCDEAEAHEKGWISDEQSQENCLKRRADYLKKHHKKAA